MTYLQQKFVKRDENPTFQVSVEYLLMHCTINITEMREWTG
jgi:hypothetical protein